MKLRARLLFAIFVIGLVDGLLTSHPVASQSAQPRVTDSILGVSLASTPADVAAKLSPLGRVERRPTRDGDGGSKESWALTGTRFSYLVIRSSRDGRIMWLTAFLREGQELPFVELADPAQAEHVSEKTAAWNVKTPQGTYRLSAKGRQGKAQVISLYPSEVKLAD